MIIYIVIPAHNEEQFIGQCLESITLQTHIPSKLVVVNDHSTDGTEAVLKKFSEKYDYINYLNGISSQEHLPGSKVVNAFYKGFQTLDTQFDIIIKLDADIVLPENYIESLINIFKTHPKAGIAGGYAYEADANGHWKLNHPMSKSHVRGAFKAYSKACFESIGGLKSAMGWDTLDELLARYHGFSVMTNPQLQIKHLRPLAEGYHSSAKDLQGKAAYRMGYDLGLAVATFSKMAYKQRKYHLLRDGMKGYLRARRQKIPKLVSPKEQTFIRCYRYRNILSKFTGKITE